MPVICLSPNGRNVYHVTEPATRLLVATLDGVAVLQRAADAAGWQLVERKLAGNHISSLLYEPRLGGVFAGVHGHGLYFSPDDGATWELRSQRFEADHVFCLGGTEQAGPVTIYAGAEPAHLYRSIDGGRTWDDLISLRSVPGVDAWNFPAPPHIGHVKSVVVDPRDARSIYVGIEQGALLKSLDGGQSWHELVGWWREDEKNYKDVHRCLLRPSNPDQLFLSTGEGLSYSPDGGVTWERLTDNTFRIGYPDQLLLSPQDDNTLFMAGSSHDPSFWRESHQAFSTIVKSTDGGRTWQPFNAGLPDPMRPNVEALTAVVQHDGFDLYAADTDGNVYRCANGEGPWSQVAAGLGPVSKGNHYERLQLSAA